MSNVVVHPTALVDPEARLGDSVKVGAFSIIGPHVQVGEGTTIHSNVVLDGHTSIGRNNTIYQFCSIGAPPQDNSYKGEPTRVVIGDNNTFREYVSIHRGTKKQDEVTIIGNNSLFMAYVHIGHDVMIGNNCTFANSVNFAGHVRVGDRVIIGGACAISQFITLGRGSYLGGASAIEKDIPIFATAYGNRARLKGINIIGMRRQGYDKKTISEVVTFFREMEANALSPRAFVERADLIEEYSDNAIVGEMVEFIKKSEVGIAPFATS